MTTHPFSKSPIEIKTWAQIGLPAAIVSIVAVLMVQALALALWPDIARFRPLDNYIRSALFVLVPAIGATATFAWLVQRRERPIRDFVALSGGLLLLSFIPDYALPDPNKTLLASTVAAFLHLVASVGIVTMLITGYQRHTR